MIAQEKAKKLVEKFYRYVHKGDSTVLPDTLAKQCAIICVDEILSESEAQYEYWQQVKAEIEKL